MPTTNLYKRRDHVAVTPHPSESPYFALMMMMPFNCSYSNKSEKHDVYYLKPHLNTDLQMHIMMHGEDTFSVYGSIKPYSYIS
jgi:hypothetical protein